MLKIAKEKYANFAEHKKQQDKVRAKIGEKRKNALDALLKKSKKGKK